MQCYQSHILNSVWRYKARAPGDPPAFTSFFTPADRAHILQPSGIIGPPVRNKMDLIQIQDFLQCYVLSLLENLFVTSWQFGMRHSFLSQPPSRWWCRCEVSSSGAGLASRGRSRGADGNFSVMDDFALIELARVTELIESLGGLTGRLNVGLGEWTLNELTLSPSVPVDSGFSVFVCFAPYRSENSILTAALNIGNPIFQAELKEMSYNLKIQWDPIIKIILIRASSCRCELLSSKTRSWNLTIPCWRYV